MWFMSPFFLKLFMAGFGIVTLIVLIAEARDNG
jgi:hypothetical protein